MSIDFRRIYTKEGPTATQTVEVIRYRDGRQLSVQDQVAVEEPLEIRLGYKFLGKPAERSISVTMRTPGEDRELAVGFLFGEGVIAGAEDIERIEYCEGPDDTAATNIVRVVVSDHVEVDMASLQRNFYTTSSCGVCGKASIEALEVQDCQALALGDFSVADSLIPALPEILRRRQQVFEKTGGIHAAGLFDHHGNLRCLREDVGRHNAMDKLVGAKLASDSTVLERSIVVLSGRASFELLQKALMAQIPIVVAVGAPSSLAIDVATDFGITLIGFTRQDRFNIYSHHQRIEPEKVHG